MSGYYTKNTQSLRCYAATNVEDLFVTLKSMFPINSR